MTTTSQRSSTITSSPLPVSQSDESSKYSFREMRYTFTFSCPFNIPSTQESAAIRIVKNLQKFGLYYAIFIWTVLFIALIPRRNVSIVYLVSATEVTFLYCLLLRAVPESVLLNRIIDKRVVLFLLFVVTCVLMIVTNAGIHLFVTLAATTPVVMVHAVLTKNEEDAFLSVVAGEMDDVSLVDGKNEAVQYENLV